MRRIGLAVVFAVSLLLAPLAVAAQQAPKIARVGVLSPNTSTAAAGNLEAFRKGLLEIGHVEGKTFVLVPRYGEARAERLPQLGRELVSLKLDVIVAATDTAVAAVKRETRTIPIVMVSSTDPVGPGSWRASRAPAEMSPGLVISLRSSVGSGWSC